MQTPQPEQRDEFRPDSAVFPEELRELLLDPSISDLMINGRAESFADRNGVVEQIGLTQPFTNERFASCD